MRPLVYQLFRLYAFRTDGIDGTILPSSSSRSRRGPSRRCTTMSTVDSTPPEVSRVESFRSWSSHLFRGRPGGRRHVRSGGRWSDMLTWALNNRGSLTTPNIASVVILDNSVSSSKSKATRLRRCFARVKNNARVVKLSK